MKSPARPGPTGRVPPRAPPLLSHSSTTRRLFSAILCIAAIWSCGAAAVLSEALVPVIQAFLRPQHVMPRPASTTTSALAAVVVSPKRAAHPSQDHRRHRRRPYSSCCRTILQPALLDLRQGQPTLTANRLVLPPQPDAGAKLCPMGEHLGPGGLDATQPLIDTMPQHARPLRLSRSDKGGLPCRSRHCRSKAGRCGTGELLTLLGWSGARRRWGGC